MSIRGFGDKKPTVGSDVYVDEDAAVIGDVRLGDQASVWPGTVLRADDDFVLIGRRTAMMDLSFAEAPHGKPVQIGDRCIISHGARLHGCRIGDSSLIGIGAIVLDNADVGPNSIVAAGALIPPETKIPPGSFVIGAPGRVTRLTTKEEREWISKEADILVAKAAKYQSQKTAT